MTVTYASDELMEAIQHDKEGYGPMFHPYSDAELACQYMEDEYWAKREGLTIEKPSDWLMTRRVKMTRQLYEADEIEQRHWDYVRRVGVEEGIGCRPRHNRWMALSEDETKVVTIGQSSDWVRCEAKKLGVMKPVVFKTMFDTTGEYTHDVNAIIES